LIKKLQIFFLLFLLSKSSSLAIECGDFSEFLEFGGHYYALSGNRLTFDQAKSSAQKDEGYIAIPNSSEENSWLANSFGGPAWIGIYDPNYSQNHFSSDKNRFKTIKNQNLSFSNWRSGEPDNRVEGYDILDGKQLVSPLGEHWVILGRDGSWADVGNHADEYNNPVRFKAIYEWDKKPQCHAPITKDPVYENKKCTDKISGGNMDGTQMDDRGQFLGVDNGSIGSPPSSLVNDLAVSGVVSADCKKDSYGTDYCPLQMAECAESWDYDPGYSKSHTGTKVEYSPKVTTGSSYEYPATATLGCEAWHACDGAGLVDLLSYGAYVTQCCHINICGMAGGGTPPICEDPSTVYTCPDGGTLSGTTCYVDNRVTACPEGYSDTAGTGDQDCSRVVNYTYYTYHCKKNEKNFYGNDWQDPINPGGDCGYQDCNSETPPSKNCKREGFKCQASPDRPCAYSDGSWKCSPFPCFGKENTQSTVIENNDKINQGFNNDGSCDGQIYIFNGKDRRCRSWDMFWGLMGGECCKNEKSGVQEVGFMEQCKADEQLLSKLRKENKNQCREIGEYCSQKLDLLFTKICVQKKKSYCCFGSKLSRIIQEQGRSQLGIGWGSPESPQCRGFTPEEFQKIDFSKVDFGEFIGDLVGDVNEKIDSSVQKIESATQGIQEYYNK